ncbi:hypothetical protein R1flu_027076 [Riccia fluitans]|uniref:Uncharacterized protein n=1 Tax=Riccia fluitans TaxID=41844 RepID=A0ABD1XLU9_9MARC
MDTQIMGVGLAPNIRRNFNQGFAPEHAKVDPDKFNTNFASGKHEDFVIENDRDFGSPVRSSRNDQTGEEENNMSDERQNVPKNFHWNRETEDTARDFVPARKPALEPSLRYGKEKDDEYEPREARDFVQVRKATLELSLRCGEDEEEDNYEPMLRKGLEKNCGRSARFMKRVESIYDTRERDRNGKAVLDPYGQSERKVTLSSDPGSEKQQEEKNTTSFFDTSRETT